MVGPSADALDHGVPLAVSQHERLLGLNGDRPSGVRREKVVGGGGVSYGILRERSGWCARSSALWGIGPVLGERLGAEPGRCGALATR